MKLSKREYNKRLYAYGMCKWNLCDKVYVNFRESLQPWERDLYDDWMKLVKRKNKRIKKGNFSITETE